jgi:hypothetical protein
MPGVSTGHLIDRYEHRAVNSGSITVADLRRLSMGAVAGLRRLLRGARIAHPGVPS